ncbi:hypothetical protein cypCar_00037070, partial [Cyprinus carpio]
MKKNNYFLNMALPSTHLFLMRNIIHHHNTYRNEQRLGNIKRAFGNDVTMNRHSQAVLVNPVSPEKVSTVPMIDVPTGISFQQSQCLKTASLDTPKAAPKTAPKPSFLTAPKPAPFGFSKLCKPWEKELNPIQDKLLSYVLDMRRPGAEIIIKEGPTCLTREEFWSLGLQRDMDFQIGNACFKLIHEAAQQH